MSDKIPPGPYCYTPIGWQDGAYKIKPCPYWSKRKDKPHQESGYCAYLGYGDWEHNGFGLLWDQVKECGINEEDPEQEENPTKHSENNIKYPTGNNVMWYQWILWQFDAMGYFVLPI